MYCQYEWSGGYQVWERLFPRSDVRKAFREIDKLKESLPSNALFMQAALGLLALFDIRGIGN
jgi:hypothetical protein